MSFRSGPWYECHEPDAKYVRDSQFVKYKREANVAIGLKPYMIMKILEEVIPDGTTGFGSYRGYATFGLDDKFKSLIEALIEFKRHECAQHIIRKWYAEKSHKRQMSDTFIAIQFMPGGSGYVETKNRFENLQSQVDITANSYEMINAPEETRNEDEAAQTE